MKKYISLCLVLVLFACSSKDQRIEDVCEKGCQLDRIEDVCEKGCQLNVDCGDINADGLAECISSCEAQLEGESKACLNASEDFTDCYTASGCATDEGFACFAESLLVLAECPGAVEDAFEDSNCCGATDVCEYANDGFCDCPDQDWDAADCK